MTYQVIVQRLAALDLDSASRWAAQHAPVATERWLNRFQEAIRTLAEQPQRCAFARENGKVEVDLRELHFGKRPYVFRVIFTIDASSVRVLRVVRAQRRPLLLVDVKKALDD